jgi:predicted Zn-dependent protease
MKLLTRSSLLLPFLCSLFLGVAAADANNNWRQRASSESTVSAREDIAEEIRFGREVAARMIARYSLYNNAKITKYVNLVGQTLVQYTNRPEIQFHFAVLNTGEVNAYAAPGGYVFVTRGALEAMQDESELAAVLAHEIAHVNEKHVVKELNIHASENSAVGGLARLIGGGTEAARVAFNQAVDKALDMLFQTGYKREDEIQADKGAVLLCTLTGYDPAGLVKYFERLKSAKVKSTEILDKTHPAYYERIVWLKETISQEGVDASSLKNFKERFADARSTIK